MEYWSMSGSYGTHRPVFSSREDETDFSQYEDEIKQMLAVDNMTWSMAALAKVLKVSTSTVHASIKRMQDVQLLNTSMRTLTGYNIQIKSLRNLIIHGVKYFFPVKPGSVTRGIVTGSLEGLSSASDLPFVWPSPLGHTRGIAIEPLHKSVPYLATQVGGSAALYQIFSAIDSIRVGTVRERDHAVQLLEDLL